MKSVTLSPKFQVVIPKEIREPLGLAPGQTFEVMNHNGLITLIPIRPIEELRGSLRGMNTDFEREGDRL